MKATRRATIPLALAGLLAAFGANAGGVITIGAPGSGGNSFPFGSGFGTHTYQQVYAASNFAGPISISDIEFFLNSPGNLDTGTFSLYLSTTSKAVNGLDTSNFANNLGGDNALFGTFTLGGTAPSTLVFNGGPFNYDPANGNLLLDVEANITQSGSSFFDARNGDAAGLFSRAHNYGSAFENWGLVTAFSYGDAQVPEPASLLLCSLGLAGLAAARRRQQS